MKLIRRPLGMNRPVILVESEEPQLSLGVNTPAPDGGKQTMVCVRLGHNEQHRFELEVSAADWRALNARVEAGMVRWDQRR